jgi:hypothetical protein
MIRWLLATFLVASAAQAQVTFSDQSAQLTPHSYTGGWEHFVGGGIAVFDCDANGLPDIFAAGGEGAADLWRNTGDFTFAPVPLPDLSGSIGAYPLDIDADGLMDLFVLRVGANTVLKGGADCSFSDATALWGIPAGDAWSTAFTAWWEDDARPVMVVGNYVDRADPDGPFGTCDDNVILRPGADGYAATALTPGYCPLSMLAGHDARGRMTLRISNDRHYFPKGGHEQMWDITEQRYLDEADGWKNVPLWGMGIASADITGDGRDDVMLTSMGDQVMQIAQADGTYAAAPFSIGTYSQRPFTGDDGRPSTGWHSEFGDVDNDGRADLFIAKGNVDQMPGLAMSDPNNLLIQNADGTFGEVADTAGVADTARSRGAALADFDGDGRLDLVVNNRRAPIRLYRNETPDTGNWVSIALAQDGGNRNAVGARLMIATETRTQYRELRVGGGHAGGQALPLHLGLGADTQATVTVTWPDGTVTTQSVAANQAITITR